MENAYDNIELIAVLMGDMHEDYSGLGAESLRRLEHAAELYKRARRLEQQPKIICVGGARPKIGIYGAEYMKQELMLLGVSEHDIYVDRESYDTETNLEVIKRECNRQNVGAVVVVSSLYHLYRVKVIAEANPDEIVYDLSCYDMASANPRPTLIERYVSINYELIANMSHKLIPRWLYRTSLRAVRYQP